MQKIKWIAVILALCLLLVLVYFAEKGARVDVTQGNDYTIPNFTIQNETTTQPTQSEQEKYWEEVLTYAEYLEMTKEEQDDFYTSFEDPAEFFEWFDAVKASYDRYREENQFDGSGSIDLGKVS